MNPKTTLSNAQIAKIFQYHKLAENPKIERITVGFTNEVHRVDGYILKLYLRKEGKDNYRREANLYKQLAGKALTPQLVLTDGSGKLVDKPYIIYREIKGDPLGFEWHKLNDQQRREIIKTLCQQIRIIASLVAKPELGRPWQAHITSGIKNRLAVIEEQKLLSKDMLRDIRVFAASNLPVLKKEVIGFIYWDVHLDNTIVDKQGKMVGLVDLEHVDPVSIDYLLNNIQRMVSHPTLNVAEEMEPFAKKKDYVHMMGWFKEFYPELFDFPDLPKRLQLYELEEILRLLPRFPEAEQLYKRLNTLLSVR